jgi:hypothetical protein
MVLSLKHAGHALTLTTLLFAFDLKMVALHKHVSECELTLKIIVVNQISSR